MYQVCLIVNGKVQWRTYKMDSQAEAIEAAEELSQEYPEREFVIKKNSKIIMSF